MKRELSLMDLKRKLLILTLLLSYPVFGQNNLPSSHELLREYIRINTTNPPGNEMKSALFLSKIFKQHGIGTEIQDLGSNRANLIATLKGDGTLPPLILLHHMDVVPAETQFWDHDPFGGMIKDGEIIGRGAVDIKGKGIMDLMAMLRLKAEGTKLKRDIIYLAVADEEINSLGSKAIIKSHEKLLEQAQFLIDEGLSGREDLFYVSLGEKAPLWLSITFKGQPGHASIPHENNPVIKAINAAQRINHFYEKQPLKVTHGTEKFLEINTKSNYRKFSGFKNSFQESLRSQLFLSEIAKNPELNALLRNTITITGMSGSHKTNTIPNTANLKMDCRLLPGTSKDEFISTIQKLAGSDALIEVEEYYPTYFTSEKSQFLQALKNVVGPDKVVTSILTSSTDSSLYRRLGLEVFGLELYSLPSQLLEVAHGNNERIPVQNLNEGIDRLYWLILELEKIGPSPLKK
jgi:acetylornithine deacetylase/succinyl-diaminopimelate desuccinylase-like protein